MFLTESKSEDGYFMCAITANVINTRTKQVLDLYVKRKVIPVKVRPAMTLTKAEYERKEDAGLKAYHNSGNPEDFFKAYRQ